MADEDIRQGDFVIEYVGEGDYFKPVFFLKLLSMQIMQYLTYDFKLHIVLFFFQNQLLMTKPVRNGCGK